MRVAIVGGGASGTLTAINLRQLSPDVELVVFEQSGVVGRGVAYSTTDERHLLNVRAGNMGAFPDAPGDFLAWLSDRGIDFDPKDFAPRKLWGEYLGARLSEIDDSIEVVPVAVTDIAHDGDRFTIEGRDFDVVVLAYGNDVPPTAIPSDLAEDATVVIKGAGLTAVDTAISVLDDYPRRHVVMVSRTGQLPKRHVAPSSTSWSTQFSEGDITTDDIVTTVNGNIELAKQQSVDWRDVIDGLRPVTQSLWQRLNADEKRHFVEYHMRDWDIRRHRMAPQIAQRLDRYVENGQLEIRSGGFDDSIVELVESANALVIDCTGLRTDVTAIESPLLQNLLMRGLIAPDAARLGIDATPRGNVKDANGEVVPGLYTLGSPLKGVLWETIAIPEIRGQAKNVAEQIVS